jgi:predicted dehydrogenase
MGAMRAAVVGAGFIGPVHVEALRRVPVPVAGILGCDRRESERAAAALGLPAPWADLKDLLADTSVDVVHIATPNRLHYPMSAAVLAAGKHVICDKPLAMNARESAALVELAEKHPKQAACVCYNIRYYPLCLQAREMVRAGEIGEVRAVRGSYQQDWLLKPTDFNWRVLAEEGGELRAVADVGTHWLDLMLSITGLEVTAVMADLRTVNTTRYRPKGEVQTFTREKRQVETEPVRITTDDCGSVMLRFSSGAQGNLWVSQVTPGRKNQVWFEIIGSEKTLQWNSEQPETLWIGSRDCPNLAYMRNPALMAERAAALSSYPAGHAEGYPDAFKGLFRDVYQYIGAGDFAAPRPFPTFAEGHREIVLCEAIQRSWHEEHWVSVA